MAPHKTLLAQLINEQNLSYEDVERKFLMAAAELREKPISVSQRQLGRWLSGASGPPRPAARRVLQHLFGVPMDRLMAPPASGGKGGASVAVVAASVPTLDNADQPTGSSPWDGGQNDVIKLAASRARNFGLIVGSTAMSREVTDQLYEDLRHLGSIYAKVPLSTILDDIVAAQDAVYGLLESRRSPGESRQLYFLAGVAGGMLAKASHDLAEPHAALTQARTAFLCAEQADHHGLMAWVRSLQSLISYWASRPAEAARYAKHAKDLATPGRGTSIVWAQLSEARALAAAGGLTEARKLIAYADDMRSSVTPDELDEIGGLFAFGPVKQLYYAGDALSWSVEGAAQAENFSSQAAEQYADRTHPEWAFGDQTGAEANLAISRLALGEPEGAREALESALSLPVAQRMNGVVLSIQRVGRALSESPHGREHTELRDEIESFCHIPMRALPR